MQTYITRIDNILNLLTKECYLEVAKKLQDLKSSIIYDIARKNCKGNKNYQLKSAKELLKNSIQKYPVNSLYCKIYKIDNTYQLCDGSTAVVLNNMIEGLELNQEKGNYLDCRRIIKDCNYSGNYEKIKLDILDLEQEVIKVKKLKSLTWENALHIKNLYFNPIFLLRAIRILGTENVEIYVHNSSKIKLAYLESELGEAIVLPITPPEEERS